MEPKKKKSKPGHDPNDKPKVVKCPADLQRLRLEKLMKNPDKPVIIPERPKGRNMPTAPDFVRNVMGSSAGAGSGEFHVYRHLRRKEYARQKFIQERSEKDILEEEYHKKIEDNKKACDEKTAKKRAKRLKKKDKAKNKKPKTENIKVESEDESSDEENTDTIDTNTVEDHADSQHEVKDQKIETSIITENNDKMSADNNVNISQVIDIKLSTDLKSMQ